MKVNAVVDATFSDQGISFPKKASLVGEQEKKGAPVVFTGLSSFIHRIPESKFSSVTEFVHPVIEDPDADSRKLPRAIVTAIEKFSDQGVEFSPTSTLTGFVNVKTSKMEFPTGMISAFRHEIGFEYFQENLELLYPRTPKKAPKPSR